MKRYEFQKLWQPIFCAKHGVAFVAHITDGAEHDRKPTHLIDPRKAEGGHFRQFTCATEGCGLLMKEIKI